MNNEDKSLIDLHYECVALSGQTVAERVSQLAARLPAAGLIALGGFPFRRSAGGEMMWCGLPVTPAVLRQQIIQALGLSAVLTYTNKSHKTLQGLGHICADRGHLWAYHWVTPTGQVWAATAGLKQWQSYLLHRDDKDFDETTRKTMWAAWALLRDIMP